jgi:hypothetical protein
LKRSTGDDPINGSSMHDGLMDGCSDKRMAESFLQMKELGCRRREELIQIWRTNLPLIDQPKTESKKMNQVFIVINKKKEKRGGIMIMDPRSISLYY